MGSKAAGLPNSLNVKEKKVQIKRLMKGNESKLFNEYLRLREIVF